MYCLTKIINSVGGATSTLEDMAYLPVILVIVYLSSSLADEFNCPSLPPLTKSAQNVYELKPQDIKVVMALGDSVTAGM